MVRSSCYLCKELFLGGFMDAKEHKRKSQEYLKAKQEYRTEMMNRDRAVHSPDSKVKYDPATGTIKETA